ncbi:hypothetical protein jhhlp_008510 [Lomentospora prolificans]|uniref:Uncharacterized protein n=1 Tax=Lomentospora prolificans TaxID=41688 RepID=A0A2N3MY90_9PEZI|nr:hypothetical protein jhhlp_008510 [Lomentospora prolificans]
MRPTCALFGLCAVPAAANMADFAQLAPRQTSPAEATDNAASGAPAPTDGLSTLVPIPTQSIDTACISSILSFGETAPTPPPEAFDFSSEYYKTATRTAPPGFMECAWVTAIPQPLDPLLSQYIQSTLNWLVNPIVMADSAAVFGQCPGVFALPDWNFRLGCPAEWSTRRETWVISLYRNCRRPEATLSQPSHDMTSQATMPEGVKVVKVDYHDSAYLVSALRDQDALAITLAAFTPPNTRLDLIAAATEAGVPYVAPNVQGTDLFNSTPADNPLLPIALVAVK